MADPKGMSAARRAYEEKQAKKAGKSLDAYLAQKQKEKQKREMDAAKPAVPATPKKRGLLTRLLDRAHKPL